MNPALWNPTHDYAKNEPCTFNGGYIYVSKVNADNTGRPPALLGDDYWGFYYDIGAWMKSIEDRKADSV